MRALVYVSVLAMAFTACLGDDFGASLEGSWQLTSGSIDGDDIPLVASHPITIDFDGERVGGTASCNSYGGSYRLTGNGISIGDLAMTEMACAPPETMTAESLYAAALTRATSVRLADDGLTLTGQGVTLAFEPLPPVPSADLMNTVWVLDGLTNADSVSSVGGERATLELFSDGSVLGGTGCRTFAGSYVVSGSEVVINELGADGHACEEPLVAQDAQVLSVLGDGFRAEIDGDTLRIWSRGDEGLIYKAETQG